MDMKILVDTGAEVNLVKKGLIPEFLFYPAKKPLKFETANGQSLAVGSQCTKVKLRLLLEKNEGIGPEGVEYDAEMYEANIRVDAILSYPWLAQTKLGIFPHHQALVLDNPELSFLFGLKDSIKKAHGIFDESARVNEISALQLRKYNFSLKNPRPRT